MLNFSKILRLLSKFNSSTGDDGKAQPDNFLFRTTGKSGDVEHCVGLFNNRNKDGVKLHDQVILELHFLGTCFCRVRHTDSVVERS